MRRRIRRWRDSHRRPCQNCREAGCQCLPLEPNWLGDLRDLAVAPAVRVGRQAAVHAVGRVRQVRIQVPTWQPAGEIYSSI